MPAHAWGWLVCRQARLSLASDPPLFIPSPPTPRPHVPHPAAHPTLLTSAPWAVKEDLLGPSGLTRRGHAFQKKETEFTRDPSWEAATSEQLDPQDTPAGGPTQGTSGDPEQRAERTGAVAPGAWTPRLKAVQSGLPGPPQRPRLSKASTLG